MILYAIFSQGFKLIALRPHFFSYSNLHVFQVAAVAVVEEVLKSWNVEQTDELLKKLEENKERKLREEQKQQKEECNRYEFRSFHGTAVAHSSKECQSSWG